MQPLSLNDSGYPQSSDNFLEIFILQSLCCLGERKPDLLLSSVNTSMSLPLPIQATCRGSGSREFRITLGVPSISVSSGIQPQLACDCSVCLTCKKLSQNY